MNQKNQKKIVLYTVITGNYDNLKEIPKNLYFPEKVVYICLTDNPNIRSKTYKIIKIDLINNDTLLTQKYYKIIINKYIEKYEKSIYIDGKIQLKNDLLHETPKLEKYDMIGIQHYKRKCLYQESAILLHPYKQMEIKDNVVPLIQYIKNDNFPKMFGLTDNCCLIRNHNKKIKETMEHWYNLVKKYSRRDQISFMYSIWKNKVNLLILEDRYHKKYLKIFNHIKPRKSLDFKNQSVWLEGFDPYENRKYYFNQNNKKCKWDLAKKYSEEHFKFLEIGYKE